MSSAFNWLPPLNCYEDDQAKTFVLISQPEPYKSDSSLPNGFITMNFKASINFISDDIKPGRRNYLSGLEIKEIIRAPKLEFVREYMSRKFPYMTAPKEAVWMERHYDKNTSSRRRKEHLLEFICRFLNTAREKKYNKSENVHYSCKLTICISVTIPDEQFKLWRSWLATMEKSYPGYGREWDNKIRRPRTEEEQINETRFPWNFQIMELDENVSGETLCVICLNHVDSKGVKLSCTHIFHEICITKWLTKTARCPMCRSIPNY